MSPTPPAAPDIVAILITRGARLALTLGIARNWEGSHGASLAPLAFPSTPAAEDAGAELALAVGVRALGCTLALDSAPWTYGPSSRHAMDRAPASGGAPFVRFERFDAPEDGGGAPRRIPTRLYRASVAGPSSGSESAVVWASPAAIRAALSGVWLEALLAMEDVTLAQPAEAAAPLALASTLVYLPAMTGERHVLRACAKYGDNILFAPGHAQEAE